MVITMVQWLNKITDAAPLAADDPRAVIRVVAMIRALWRGDYHGWVKIVAPDRLRPGRQWARRTHLGCGRAKWSSPELATYRPCATCLKVLPRRSKPLKLFGHRRWPCHGESHESFAPVLSPLSGRQHAMPKLGATALRPYKLSVPSAPLGNHTPNTPSRASDYPLKRSNFEFPPNLSRTP
jgi:hypothetical protein